MPRQNALPCLPSDARFHSQCPDSAPANYCRCRTGQRRSISPATPQPAFWPSESHRPIHPPGPSTKSPRHRPAKCVCAPQTRSTACKASQEIPALPPAWRTQSPYSLMSHPAASFPAPATPCAERPQRSTTQLDPSRSPRDSSTRPCPRSGLQANARSGDRVAPVACCRCDRAAQSPAFSLQQPTSQIRNYPSINLQLKLSPNSNFPLVRLPLIELIEAAERMCDS